MQIRTWLNDWRDRARFEAAVQKQWPQVAACHSIVGSAGFRIPQAAVEAELVAIVGKDLRALTLASPGRRGGGRRECRRARRRASLLHRRSRRRRAAFRSVRRERAAASTGSKSPSTRPACRPRDLVMLERQCQRPAPAARLRPRVARPHARAVSGAHGVGHQACRIRAGCSRWTRSRSPEAASRSVRIQALRTRPPLRRCSPATSSSSAASSARRPARPASSRCRARRRTRGGGSTSCSPPRA